MSLHDIKPRPLLEIACFNGTSAISAAEGGADRIELCHDYASGGLSPDPGVLSQLKSQLSIPIFVMIRPHSEGFVYNKEDFEIMKSTLVAMKEAGADGFVFGILNQKQPGDTNSNSWIDIERNTELVRLAGRKPCTFHRAFDCIPEHHWGATLSELAKCGFASILTSGGPSGNTALECIDELGRLFQELRRVQQILPVGTRVPEIIVGGGVRPSNVRLLNEKTSAPVFHSSALVNQTDDVDVNEVGKLRELIV
ncbi:copper homeostasis protein [Penicillium angulare]|uniref:copper homeostasis protein n=1 Tax=Penicillium angulare TaxID=116970 RepID=UPI0025413104|nr:copper homeostasis protein [Penicillium angulare]KAJ5256742.1 copper homeostasis protein [Penicillium angulare]